MKKYNSFKEFYPYYLSEHSNKTCRALHYIGMGLGLTCLVIVIISRAWQYIPLSLIPGYLFAWIGHFVFEKNRPATFQYPVYSFMGDFVMFKDFIIGFFSPSKKEPGKQISS